MQATGMVDDHLEGCHVALKPVSRRRATARV
jgi:3-methyladenine DNA glycosylase Tag